MGEYTPRTTDIILSFDSFLADVRFEENEPNRFAAAIYLQPEPPSICTG